GRMISHKHARLSPGDVKKLKLKWSFAYPDASRASSQPLAVGGGLYVGGQDGTVYALDAKSSCVHWTFKASGEVRGTFVFHPGKGRNAVSLAGPALFFGDIFANVYAVSAATGDLIWKIKADEHPTARVFATPVLWSDKTSSRLYVPIASYEEVAASKP